MALLFREPIRNLGGEPEKGLTCRKRPREPSCPRGAAGSRGARTVPVPSQRGRGHWESATRGWESGSSGGMFPRKPGLLLWRSSRKHPCALMRTSLSSSPKFTTVLGPRLPAPSQAPSSPGTEPRQRGQQGSGRSWSSTPPSQPQAELRVSTGPGETQGLGTRPVTTADGVSVRDGHAWGQSHPRRGTH